MLKTFEPTAKMTFKVAFLILLCAVIFTSGNKRVKRGKYYSYPPRFYKRPPPPNVIKGPYSYTPPPNYMRDDDGPHRPKDVGLGPYRPKDDGPSPYRPKDDGPSYYRPKDDGPSHYRPKDDGPYRTKVSKPPTNDLGDDDINNLVKYLSKQDLDRIVEMANEKERFSHYKDDDRPSYKRPERTANLEVYEVDYNTPNYVTTRPKIPSRPIYATQPDTRIVETYQDYPPSSRDMFVSPPNYGVKSNHYNSQVFNSDAINSPTQPEITSGADQALREHITPSFNANNDVIFTDSSIMKEEELPKPLNLREDEDFQISYTNNVPRIANAETYSVESFKDLPLMNYHNSKLDSVSSYYVPHYTVTASKSQSSLQTSPLPSPSQPRAPPIERAPSGSTGKDQSDAHLKATRIWTHRSKGTAYTLHDDGTLSLEKPRVTTYGHP